MSQAYKDLLTTLAQKIGQDPAALVATDQITIDNLPINMQLINENEHAEVVLCTLLGTVPAERWTQVTRALLQANHMWIGTNGGALGLLGDNDMVSLSVRRPLRELNAETFADLLIRTTDFAHAWQNFIAHGDQSAPNSLSDNPIMPKIISGQSETAEKKLVH